MRLDELAHAYLERANRVFVKATEEKNPERHARLMACNQAYLAARADVQKLIDQGLMPSGQVWNLRGRILPHTTWTPTEENQ